MFNKKQGLWFKMSTKPVKYRFWLFVSKTSKMIMTTISITIQDGKITWIEQRGEEIPNPKWDNFVCETTKILEQ